MIKVESLLYKLDLKLNKLATLQHQEIPIENKILYLNEAIIKLIKVKMDRNNPLGEGFEAFKKRYEDIQILVEASHDHPLIPTKTDSLLNKWVVDLSVLTSPAYMFYVDSYALATKGACVNRIIYLDNDLTKHADVPTLLANNNYKPSFEYQESFNTKASDKLEVYSDGTFDFTKVYVSYIRYPQKVDYVGYTHLDGTESITKDSDLPSYLEDEILNYAIEDIAMSIGDQQIVQYTQLREKTSE